jgi:hypothetical protein
MPGEEGDDPPDDDDEEDVPDEEFADQTVADEDDTFDNTEQLDGPDR